MSELSDLIDDLVVANRILANENVVDAFGHVSIRHPNDSGRFFLSRARSPQLIEADDIMEFSLDGVPLDPQRGTPYAERFIHSAIYELRPEIHSVVHSHSKAVIPFGVGGEKIRPLMHNCAPIGAEVPIWDSRSSFGETDLLVSNPAMGRDLARFMDVRPSVLMRGHGSVAAAHTLRLAVYIAIALQTSAELQAQVHRYDNVTFLSPGEIEKGAAMLRVDPNRPLIGLDRAWEYWCYRAGMPFRPVA
ncbi:MAG TPA: class II aldolase/adducin family protein [Xanthobacteraceae bacterium]|nr:class II aldolase/adducin family protein [Xanthobacteraceae bacterium]